MRWSLTLLALPVAALAAGPPSPPSSFVVQCANAKGWRLITDSHNPTEYTVDCGETPTVRINTSCFALPHCVEKEPRFTSKYVVTNERSWLGVAAWACCVVTTLVVVGFLLCTSGVDDDEEKKDNEKEVEYMGEVENEIYLHTCELIKAYNLVLDEMKERRIPDEALWWAEDELSDVVHQMKCLAEDLKSTGDSFEAEKSDDKENGQNNWVTAF